jgi:hypothetical protein
MGPLFISNGDQIYRVQVEYAHIHNQACDVCNKKETTRLTDFRINFIQNDRSNLYVATDTKLGREIAQRFASRIPPDTKLCYGCFLDETKPWQAT